MDTEKEQAARWVDIDSIKPWGRNPKRLEQGDIDRMVKSIERFGWADVIVAREADGEIISGHLRHAAAKALGMAKVPVRYLPIDSAEAHALAVAVTQHEAVRTFDESIGALLADMQADGVDLDGLGWSEDELRDIIAAGQVEELEPEDPDDVPEVATVVHSVKGEVYELGPHRLVCGDSFNVDNWGDIEEIDCVITDPPYGMNHHPGMSAIDSVKGEWQSPPRHYDPVIGDDEDFDPSLFMLSLSRVNEQFWFGADYYAERIGGKNEGSWLVWDKRQGIEEMNWSTSEFELCWSKARHHRQIIRQRWSGLMGTESQDIRGRVHPTQKPLQVIEFILNKYTRSGDLVFDPFGGSGSTLMACAETGRVARLIELDPKYCDVIRRRWTRYAKKNGLDAGSGALEDADVHA